MEVITFTGSIAAHRPSIAIGEDDYSYTQHMKKLEEEYAKIIPDNKNVAELMAKTFAMRRKEIEEQPQKVSESLKKYPFLKSLDIVCIKQNFQ